MPIRHEPNDNGLPPADSNEKKINPIAPAEPDKLEVQINRHAELNEKASDVSEYIEEKLNDEYEKEDDDTDPVASGDNAESACQIDEAIKLLGEVKNLLEKPTPTNDDIEMVETLLDDAENKLAEATPSSYCPSDDDDADD